MPITLRALRVKRLPREYFISMKLNPVQISWIFFHFVLGCPTQKCPKIVHGVMMDCWSQDRTQRPRFKEILRRLEDLIRTPEMLNDDLVCYTR